MKCYQMKTKDSTKTMTKPTAERGNVGVLAEPDLPLSLWAEWSLMNRGLSNTTPVQVTGKRNHREGALPLSHLHSSFPLGSRAFRFIFFTDQYQWMLNLAPGHQGSEPGVHLCSSWGLWVLVGPSVHHHLLLSFLRMSAVTLWVQAPYSLLFLL